jgi:hypothetical protein
MSTILPEDIFGGRRMDGNSIYRASKDQIKLLNQGTQWLYQSFILSQKHRDTRIDFADCERD